MPAKKKQAKDRTAPFFMTRIAEEYQAPLRELAKKNHRTLRGEIELAIDQYLASQGLSPRSEQAE